MAKKEQTLDEVEISKNFPTSINTHIDWNPATNIIECENLIIIEMELPGVQKDDINIVIKSNQELIVRGVKRKRRDYKKHVTYYLFEREFGTFYKRIQIDFPIDTDSIVSILEDGVLVIEIKKKKVEKIQVKIK